MVGAAGFELATLCSQSSNATNINQLLNVLLSNGGGLFVCQILKLRANAVRQFCNALPTQRIPSPLVAGFAGRKLKSDAVGALGEMNKTVSNSLRNDG